MPRSIDLTRCSVCAQALAENCICRRPLSSKRGAAVYTREELRALYALHVRGGETDLATLMQVWIITQVWTLTMSVLSSRCACLPLDCRS